MQAVDEEDEEGSGDEFGGGVLHKRQRAAAQDEQSDGEAADLQQVTTHTPCFNDWQPALSRTILYLLPFMMHCPCYLALCIPVPCLVHCVDLLQICGALAFLIHLTVTKVLNCQVLSGVDSIEIRIDMSVCCSPWMSILEQTHL